MLKLLVDCWSVWSSACLFSFNPLIVSLAHCKEAPQSNEAHNLTTSDEPGDTLSDVRQKSCQQSDTNVKFWRPECCLQKIKCKIVLHGSKERSKWICLNEWLRKIWIWINVVWSWITAHNVTLNVSWSVKILIYHLDFWCNLIYYYHYFLFCNLNIVLCQY